jgi:hypothetical protein
MCDVTEPALIKYTSTSVEVKSTWFYNSIPPYICSGRVGYAHFANKSDVHGMYLELVNYSGHINFQNYWNTL